LASKGITISAYPDISCDDDSLYAPTVCDNIEKVINLPNAIKIKAKDCSKLRVLSKLPKLQSLNAVNCMSLEVISNISDDMSILKLDVRGCEELNEIKGSKICIRIRDV
jgi:hypothetical protein